MVAYPRSSSLTRSVPLIGAALAGALVVAGCVLVPSDTLEIMVWNSGIAAIVPAAAPPLGTTARIVLALATGVISAAVTWAALYLLFGPGGVLAPRPRRHDGVPALRRADAHPDNPARAPMKAAELGTPMMEITAPPVGERELDVPKDLNMPLAAFDPGAVLATPREPVRPVAPLVKPALEPGERFDTFEPEPAVPPAPAQRHEPVPQQTIESLRRRLEEGAGRRAQRA
jgi:hypothetical protein